jgi:hypothetical protein
MFSTISLRRLQMTASDTEKRLKLIEDTVRGLQDIEEIKNLQKIYGYYLEHWQWEQVVDLFSDSPDTSVEINDTGVFVGKKSIRNFFWSRPVPKEFLHVLMQVNDVVHVDENGQKAKGRWYGFGPHAIPTDEKVQAAFSCGIYENEYVKENDRWKFKKVLWSRLFYTSYEDGWVKTPVKMLNFAKVMGKDSKPVADRPSTTYAPYPSGYLLPYHFKNPVTGR